MQVLVDHETRESYEKPKGESSIFTPFALFAPFVVQIPVLLARFSPQRL
jgi:hypothetical protein